MDHARGPLSLLGRPLSLLGRLAEQREVEPARSSRCPGIWERQLPQQGGKHGKAGTQPRANRQNLPCAYSALILALSPLLKLPATTAVARTYPLINEDVILLKERHTDSPVIIFVSRRS